MADPDPTPIDSLGRQAGNISAAFDSLVGSLSAAAANIEDLPESLKKEVSEESSATVEEMKNLVKAISGFEGFSGSGFEEEIEKVRLQLEALNEQSKELQKVEKKSTKNFQEINNAMKLFRSGIKKTNSSVADLAKGISNPVSAGVPGTPKPIRDVAGEMAKELNVTIEKGNVSIASADISGVGGGSGGGGSGGGGGGGGGLPDAGGPSKDKSAEEFANYTKGLSNKLSGYVSGILGGSSLTQVLFKGSVKDATHFRKEMRMVAYEIEGIGASTRGLQADFGNLGSEIVKQTGAPLEATQEAYLRNLKKGFVSQEKGIKSQKEGLKVIKSGIHLSTMIGSDAAATADLFGEWNRTLGLSSNQMSQLALDSKNIAKSTGITGDELIEAMKSSEGLIKNLRNQGNLTNSAMANIIKGAAEAKKLGVGDQFNKIADALTSTNKFFFEADDKTKAFLYSMGGRLGKMNEMASGEFMKSRTNMTAMADDMEGTIVKLSENIGADISSMDDLGKLTPEQRKNLSIAIKATTGMEIGEFERMAKVAKKQGEGLSGVLGDLDKTLKSSTATVEEKKLAEQEYDKAIQGTGSTLLSAVSEQLKKGGNIEDSLKEMFRVDKSFEESFKADAETIAKSMGKTIEGMTDAEKFQLASVAAAEKLQARAKEKKIDTKDIASGLKDAIANNDTLKIRELNAELQKLGEQVDVEEKKGSDPITELGHQLEKTNEYLRGLTSGAIGKLIDVLGSFGLFAIVLGASFGSMALAFPHFLMKFQGILSWFQTAFGTSLGGAVQGMGGALRGLGPIVGKAMGPLMLAFGGLKGAMEAKEAGRTTLEGGVLGMLTGGAKTGSFLSPMVGAKKGGVVDKALGVAGGAAWGAAAGASIGSIIPVIGTGVGAVFGAVIGGGTELLKIFTEGTDILSDLLGPIQVYLDYWIGSMKDIWDILSGIVTLNFGKVIDSTFKLLARQILYWPTMAWSVLRSVFVGLPKLILKAFQAVVFGIPKMIMDSIKGAFESLAASEWVGPLFKPISEAFNFIYEGFMAVWTPLSNAFQGIYDVFTSITSAIFGCSKESSVLTHVMGWVKFGIQTLAGAIGLLLQPVVWLAQAFGWVLKQIGNLIQGIISPFKYLYDVLVGNSIVPDLVFGIIKFFAMLPSRIFKFLGGMLTAIPSMIGKAFLNVGSYLESFGTDSIFGTILSQIGALYTFIGNTIGNVVKVFSGLFKILEGVFSFDGSKIWEGISSIGSAIIGQLSNVGNYIIKGVSNIGNYFYKTLKKLPMFFLRAMKGALIDFPKWLAGKIIDTVYGFGTFLSSLPSLFLTGLKKGLSSFGKWLFDTLTWPFRKIYEGVEWIANKLMDAWDWAAGALASLFDLSAWGDFASKIGSWIIDGLQSIFIDMPIWLGKTILDGIISLVSAIPGAMYTALHSAASMIGLGWMVEKMAGGGGGAKAGAEAPGATQAGGADTLVGTLAVGAGALYGLKKLAPNISGYAQKAFEFSKNLTPNIIKYAGDAFGKVKSLAPSITKYAGDAFSKVKSLAPSVMKYAGDAFSKLKSLAPSITKYAGDAFSKVKSLAPSVMKYAGDTFSKLKSLTPSITKYAGDAFSKVKSLAPSVMKYAGDAFGKIKSLTPSVMKYAGDAFSKAKSLFPSITKYAGDAFSKLKSLTPSITKYAGDAFGKIKSLTPSVMKYAGDAFGKIKSLTPSVMKYAGDAFGKVKSLAPSVMKYAGDAFSKVKSLTPSITKYAGDAFSKVKSLAPSVMKYAGDAFSKVKSLAPSVMKYAGDAFSKVKSLAPSVIKYAGDAFSKVKSLAPSITKYAGDAFSKVKSLAPSVMKYAGDAFSKVKSLAPSVMKYAGDAFSKAKSLFPGIGKYATSAFDKIKSIAPNIGKYATSAFDKIKSMAPNIGKYASNAFNKVKSMAPGLGKYASNLLGKGKGMVGKGISAVGGFAKSFVPKVAGSGGLIGSLFGKAAGATSKIGKIISSGGGVVGSLFGKAGGLVAKMGMGTVGKSLLKKLPFIGAIAGAGFAIASLVKGDVGGAIKELASGLAGAIPFIGPVLSAGIDIFGDTLIGGAKAVWNGTKELGSTIWNGAKTIGSTVLNGAKAIGSTAWNGAKKMGSAIWDGAKWYGKTWMKGAKAIGAGVMWVGKKYIQGWKNVGSNIWNGAAILGEGVVNLASTAWDGAKNLGETLWEGTTGIGSKLWSGISSLGSAIGGFASNLWGGAKSVGSAVGEFASNAWEGAKSLSTKAVEGAKSIWGGVKSWFGYGAKESNMQPPQTNMDNINKLNTSIATKLETGGVHSIPAVRPSGMDGDVSTTKDVSVANVQPLHLRDISQTILREKAGANSGGGKLQSDELTRMEDASHKQVDELEQIREGILELVALMKPRGGSSLAADSNQVAGSTRDSRRPMGSAIYGKMRNGNPVSNANRSVNTTDVT